MQRETFAIMLPKGVKVESQGDNFDLIEVTLPEDLNRADLLCKGLQRLSNGVEKQFCDVINQGLDRLEVLQTPPV